MSVTNAALVAALALAAALGCGPAQGGNSHQVAVSATILARKACRFTDSAPSQIAFDPSPAGAATPRISTTFRCTGSDSVTHYRIRSNDGLHASSTSGPRMRQATEDGTLVLTLEP